MVPRRHQRMLLSILDLDAITVEDIMVPRQEIIGLDLDRSLGREPRGDPDEPARPAARLPRLHRQHHRRHSRARPAAGARARRADASPAARAHPRALFRSGRHAAQQAAAEFPAAPPPFGVRRRRVRRRAGIDHDARHRQRARRRARQRLERHRSRRHEGERSQLRRRRERQRAAAEPRHELESADRRTEDVERAHRRAARDDSGVRHGRDGGRTIRSRSSTRASTASSACACSRRAPLRRRRQPPERRLSRRVHERERLAQAVDGHHLDSELAARRVRARHERRA